MRLTYWVSDCLNDASSYSIRRRTRREVNAALAAGEEYRSRYSEPRKVTVEYTDAFNLIYQALSEGGIE